MTHAHPADFALHTHASFSEFDETTWNACAFGEKWQAGMAMPNPFISHQFLCLLEESGSIGPGTGWRALPISLTESSGRVAGVAPAFIKSHSYGEYIFDHAFADAYERAGGRYYPKLLLASPFSPVTGPRLLARDQSHATKSVLAGAICQLAERLQLSSAHINFLTAEEQLIAEENGWLSRIDQQFHWQNQSYGDFDEFLATLTSRKRKELKRERKAALENGITIDWITGRDITPDICDRFFEFYMDTASRKWGQPYLTKKFFHLLAEKMAHDTLFIFAKREGSYIAGALNMIGNDTLYGRNWGAVEHHPFLHFEVCYYQAIDFAIERGLKTVEAGAQGGHKLARGYEPTPTFSSHYFPNEGFHKAVGDYLEHERAEVLFHVDVLKGRTPFKQKDD